MSYRILDIMMDLPNNGAKGFQFCEVKKGCLIILVFYVEQVFDQSETWLLEIHGQLQSINIFKNKPKFLILYK